MGVFCLAKRSNAPLRSTGAEAEDILKVLQTIKATKSLEIRHLHDMNYCFEAIIGGFVDFSEALSLIKREYDACLSAIVKDVRETARFRSKIQKLLISSGTNQQEDYIRAQLVRLAFRFDMINRENEELRKSSAEEDRRFLVALGRSYDRPMTNDFMLGDKQMQQIRHNEKWDYVTKWIAEHAKIDPVFEALRLRMETQPVQYKQFLEREQLIDLFDSTAQDAKKIKAAVDEQTLKAQRLKEELTALQEKRQVLEDAQAANE